MDLLPRTLPHVWVDRAQPVLVLDLLWPLVRALHVQQEEAWGLDCRGLLQVWVGQVLVDSLHQVAFLDAEDLQLADSHQVSRMGLLPALVVVASRLHLKAFPVDK